MSRRHFWALNVIPGAPALIPSSRRDLHISTASLKLEEVMNYRSTAINLLPTSQASNYHALSAQEGYAFCILTPGRAEHTSLDLWLTAGQSYIVECIGPNPVSLLGYHVDTIDEQVSGDRKAVEVLANSVTPQIASHTIDKGVSRDRKAVEVPDNSVAPHVTSRKRARPQSSASDIIGSGETPERIARSPSSQIFKKAKVDDSHSATSLARGVKPVKMEAARGQGDVSMVPASDIAPNAPVLKQLPLNPDVITKVMSRGEGELSIQLKDKVTLVLEGRLSPNGHQFLANRNNIPTLVHIGYSSIFEDLQAALIGAKAGCRMSVILPPHRAYGPHGHEGFGVPPNAQVLFDVTIVSIQKAVPPGTTT
ncbi:hypothetical protein FOMPIDRAFT_1050653 [Fomitopsis schrenkii]|uniref:peptidylprolyl isomerase n=1 Tax=Fomitopsis schrenkii TaxID=2126942 RepID=S8FM40_FOMSC|nr:hypothetical protein FOMPIDRAFT_1050653 [Fomitopsis schrenkii]